MRKLPSLTQPSGRLANSTCLFIGTMGLYCTERIETSLPKRLNARNRMNLIPAVVAISNVSASDTNTIAYFRDHHFIMKTAAVSLHVGSGGSMIANHFDDEFTVGVHHVSQIQDRFLIRIKSDVEIAIRCAVHGDYAALNGGTRFDDSEPLCFIHMLPEFGITAFDRQFHRRLPRVAKPGDHDQSDDCSEERESCVT